VSNKEDVVTVTHDRIAALGIVLPAPWRLPEGVHRAFEIVRVHGDTAYVAGHGPVDGDTIRMQGTIGDDLTVEDGYDSARLTAHAITASLSRVIGDLDTITWLRATVYVNAVAGLAGPSLTRVGDGFSDFINGAFGDRGQHARATIGAASLAFGVPTIIEATVALR
jgi:enamine deaminase RidA (YjgF/YER057c/UK114 family)